MKRIILMIWCFLIATPIFAQQKVNEIDSLYEKYKGKQTITINSTFGEVEGNISVTMNPQKKPVEITIFGEIKNFDAISEIIYESIQEQLKKGYEHYSGEQVESQRILYPNGVDYIKHKINESLSSIFYQSGTVFAATYKKKTLYFDVKITTEKKGKYSFYIKNGDNNRKSGPNATNLFNTKSINKGTAAKKKPKKATSQKQATNPATPVKKKPVAQNVTATRLANGATPYANLYGVNKSCSGYGCSKIKVQTPSSSDVLVTIKKNDKTGKVVKHAFIRAGSSYTFEMPNGTYQPFFIYGKGWNPNKVMKTTPQGILKGGFIETKSVGTDYPQVLYDIILEYELILQQNGNFSTRPSNTNEAL
jgi:hypothetical protein